MTEIGCYVERALDRLTVTTMLLCSDSAPKILAGRPASAGLPFLLRCAVLRCVMSCDVPNRVAMWISVDDTPRVWITHILRHRCRFGLIHVRFRFSIGGMSDAISSLQVPPVPLPSYGGRDARVTCSPKIRRSQRPECGSRLDPSKPFGGKRSRRNGSIRRRTPWTRERRHDGPGLPWRAVSWVRRWNRRPHG